MNMTDYEETRRTFRLRVPDDFNFTRDVVEDRARKEPDTVALVAVDPAGEDRRELTFSGKIRRVELRQQEGAR
jgi:acetyl-CoA synthetase